MQCSLNGLHFAGKTLRVQCPLRTQRNARRMSHMQGSGYVLTHLATLSVYRSRFEALPSIGSAIFAEHKVKRSNNATDNGHIYARGFADDCYGLGCDL